MMMMMILVLCEKVIKSRILVYNPMLATGQKPKHPLPEGTYFVTMIHSEYLAWFSTFN